MIIGWYSKKHQNEAETKLPSLRRRHFQMHFREWNVRIPIKKSLKFVLKGPINNIPALVQIMAWRRPDDMPLPEPMMVRLLSHIYVTSPAWRVYWTVVNKYANFYLHEFFYIYFTNDWQVYPVMGPWTHLTLKQLTIVFQSLILFSDVFHNECNILVWNWSNTRLSYQQCGCCWPGALAPGQ